MTIREAAAEIGISDDTLYRMARDGTLPTVNFRRRILVPRQAIEELAARSMESFRPDLIAGPQGTSGTDP